jgi:hypothetical protein
MKSGNPRSRPTVSARREALGRVIASQVMSRVPSQTAARRIDARRDENRFTVVRAVNALRDTRLLAGG